MSDGRIVVANAGLGELRLFGESGRTLIFRAPAAQSVIVHTTGRATPFGRQFPGDESVREAPRRVGRAGLNLDEAPRHLLDDWLDRWLENMPGGGARRAWRAHYEALMSSESGPAKLPAFKSVMVQAGARMWLDESDATLARPDSSRWKVIPPSVDLSDVGDAVLPPGFQPHEIGEDYVLGVWRDELGVEYVRLYDLIEQDG